MFLLAAVKMDPLGHVLDKTLVALPNGTPLITMHMLTLVLAALLMLWALSSAAEAIATGPESQGNDRYLTKGRWAQFIELITLYLRDNMVKPVLGHSANKYFPFLMTVFFFVLFNNLLGLVPLLDIQHLIGKLGWDDSHWAIVGGTATGNLAVTGGLAFIAFVVIQVHGFRELGVVGWCKHLTAGAPWFVAPLMVVVELIGLIIKPAALAIRLFANMLAGHTLMATLALFGLMALHGLQSWSAAFGISFVAGIFAVAISFLELFVAFLQAFIFMFLTAIFIAQMQHHDEHEHGHEGEAAHA